VRASRDIWVDGHGEDKLVVVFVEVVKVIHPKIFDIAGIDPAVAKEQYLSDFLCKEGSRMYWRSWRVTLRLEGRPPARLKTIQGT
jgi:hypothetical protein